MTMQCMMHKYDLMVALATITSRAVVNECAMPPVLSIQVPFYRVRAVRKAIRHRLPLAVLLDVHPLSFLQHFKQRHILIHTTEW